MPIKSLSCHDSLGTGHPLAPGGTRRPVAGTPTAGEGGPATSSLISSDKSPGSRVSLYCTALGKRVPYRMALTGTPAHNSPLDVYAQYRFLDPGIFGTNFSAFRDRYAVMGGYGGYQVIAYRAGRPIPRCTEIWLPTWDPAR